MQGYTSYLEDEFNTSNSLEGKDEERFEALSLANRVTLKPLHCKVEVSVLLSNKKAGCD